MGKLIEKRKISSRIKFALKDVIELRASGWVPRRDEGNPKTIDQIHREAQLKEKESDMARQQDKMQRKLEPKGVRGEQKMYSVIPLNSLTRTHVHPCERTHAHACTLVLWPPKNTLVQVIPCLCGLKRKGVLNKFNECDLTKEVTSTTCKTI